MTEPEPIPTMQLDNAAIWDAVLPRLKDLVLSGRFTLGPELEEFENEAARLFGCEWCVGTSSGTSALALTLKAALPQRSRVAIPANTFFATLEAVVTAGHVPVVIDNDEDYLISVEQLAESDVQAVIPVHLYGLPADMKPLMGLASERGWFVLEDASQAHGATVDGRPVGSIGDAAAFSAYPTKNLGAWGDAGFVTGNDPDLEAKVRSLRHHGQRVPNMHETVGGTERLDNIQALVLGEKLKFLAEEIAGRRRIASRYTEILEDAVGHVPGDRGERTHVFHQFVVRVSDRDSVRELLESQRISTSVHYPTPVHLQKGAEEWCEVPRRPERAERWADELLSLPIFPSMPGPAVERVGLALRAALA